MRKLFAAFLTLSVAAGLAFSFTGAVMVIDTNHPGYQSLSEKIDKAVETNKTTQAPKSAAEAEKSEPEIIKDVFIEGPFTREQMLADFPLTINDPLLNITFDSEVTENGNTAITYEARKTDLFDRLELDMSAKDSGNNIIIERVDEKGNKTYKAVKASDVSAVIKIIKGEKENNYIQVPLIRVNKGDIVEERPASQKCSLCD
jgi:hypothetical protein